MGADGHQSAEPSAKGDVTELLHAWRNGSRPALDHLTAIIHQELRRLARRYLYGERAGHTLQTSALVNEVYIRLADCTRMDWQDRAHFLAVSAQLMRRILVDHARRRNLKRGGNIGHVPLHMAVESVVAKSRDLIALDDALNELARADARKAQVVELRYFGGLSVEETAQALNLSAVTVMRDWSSAKAWLYREITGGIGSGS